MELLQLRYFVSVAQFLNISKAARHHMIPQPAMSKTISKLEHELGTPLFDRTRNKLSLTENGRIFYRSAMHSLGELDDAVRQINQSDGPLRGELKILVRQHRDTVVDCIMAFKKQHPQVSFRVSYEQDNEDCRDYDLCIACEQPDESFAGRICLITEKMKLLVSAQHPAARMQCVPFGALESEEFAMISRNSNQWQQTQLQCQLAGFKPRVSITCADLHCLLKYVAAGMAITVGPEIAWRNLHRSGVVFVPTQPEIFRATYVFWNEQRTPTRLINAYKDFLVAYFSHLTPEADG